MAEQFLAFHEIEGYSRIYSPMLNRSKEWNGTYLDFVVSNYNNSVKEFLFIEDKFDKSEQIKNQTVIYWAAKQKKVENS